MAINLSGKRALVTGAGQGIGREIAVVLAEYGAQVVAVSKTAANLATLKDEIGCETVAVDLADAEATRAAIEGVGDIDLLVNNAGISILEPFLETTLEAFDAVMAVNVRAVLVVSQVVARGMVARGTGGAIVNVSSQASMRGIKDHTSYCTSKGALDQLTRVMALELGPYDIRVNSVNPTVTLTAMGQMAWSDPAKSGPMLARIPLGKFAQPRHVAENVAYLLSDAASMVNGTILPIDGGWLIT
jgi:L-xylulose reductase